MRMQELLLQITKILWVGAFGSHSLAAARQILAEITCSPEEHLQYYNSTIGRRTPRLVPDLAAMKGKVWKEKVGGSSAWLTVRGVSVRGGEARWEYAKHATSGICGRSFPA